LPMCWSRQWEIIAYFVTIEYLAADTCFRKSGYKGQPTALSWKVTDFWDIVPCSLVEVYRRFRGTYYLRCQDDETSALYLRSLSAS
jgi:hypothetical protein